MDAVDWKQLKKIDAHIHIIPDEVHRANPDAEDVWAYADLERYRAVMEENHVEKAVIMPLNDPFLMSMGFTADDVHRNLFDMKQRSQGRFYTFADLDVRNASEESVCFLRRAVDVRKTDGIKVHPNNSGIAADSPYFDAVYAFAEERGIPVAIHCYPGRENDLSSADRIVRIAERYPALKLIVCHMGAFEWERLLPLGCHVDISAILPVYARILGIAKTNQLLRAFGVHRLLFATDYPDSRVLPPNSIYDAYFEILGQMDFTPREAERIACGNIHELPG